MTGGRTSADVQVKIGGAPLTRVPKRKSGWSGKGGQQLTADRVWTDGRALHRPPIPAVIGATFSLQRLPMKWPYGGDGCTLPRPRHVTDFGGFGGVPGLG